MNEVAVLITAELRIVILITVTVTVLFFLYRIIGTRLAKWRLTGKRRANSRDPRGFVRRTDLQRLTDAEEKQRQEAYKLLEQGMVREASQILESINLHREAVEALEKAGCIDEACAILVRMQRPVRAAALFARHHMHERAAECFLLANQPEDAAKSFMEAAREEPSFFERAARAYESVPNLEMALKAYALGKCSERVVGLAYQTSNWGALAEYMSDLQDAKEALRHIKTDQIKVLAENLPINQKTVQAMALWCGIVRKMDLVAAVINKLLRHHQWLVLYWSIIKPELARAAVISITKGIDPETKAGRSFLVRNANALFESKQYQLAAKLYECSRRFAIVAKCHALAGEIDLCQQALDKSKDEHLLNRLEEAMRLTAHHQSRMNPGTWHPETLKAVQQALSEVDPHTEEQAAKSPFAMVA